MHNNNRLTLKLIQNKLDIHHDDVHSPINLLALFCGENSQIPCFGKIYGKLVLFRKYLGIYHFFSTRGPQNRVLNST